MKTIITLLIFLSANHVQAKNLRINEVLSFQSSREGGAAVGNGGGTVVCRNIEKTIKSVELLDLFEARVLRGMENDLSRLPGSWKEKAQAIINRLGKHSKLREEIYSYWLATFENESLILKDIVFNLVPDAMNIGVPKGCDFEQAAVQIVPRFPLDYRYYLNGELWEAMDDNQKAGLVLHEFVYREAINYDHTDSIATRYFVGMIVSPAIEKMQDYDFLSMLHQVHFEQTDIQIGYTPTEFQKNIKVYFNPSNWWRSAPNGVVPMIHLKGRMVINIGECMNVGCTDWRSFHFNNGLSKVVCSGVKYLFFPNGESELQIINSDGVLDTEHCKRPVVFNFENDFSLSTRASDLPVNEKDYLFYFDYSKMMAYFGHEMNFSIQAKTEELKSYYNYQSENQKNCEFLNKLSSNKVDETIKLSCE